jgi:dihydroflavonol-4-reductase
MKALVTGATGLVGSHIVRALIRHGHAARALVRASSDRAALSGLPVDVVIGDVLDPASLAAAMDGCDVVFHAAAYFTYWGRSLEDLQRTASTGTANVLNAAAMSRIRRVIVTSSSVVFGYSDGPVARDERSLPQAEDTTPYVTSKILQDRLALEMSSELDLDVVLVCPTVVVGPFAPTLGPSNGVISAYLDDPLRLTYPGGGNIVAASDVGEGHVIVATAGSAGERYIIGGENLEWRTIHGLISELCGTQGPLLTANHTLCYLGAFGEEIRAQLLDRAPKTTRRQASMVGRYYWYSHRRAARLGFVPMPARAALSLALSWLVASTHVSREARTRLRLADEVWAARRSLRAAESALRVEG